MSNEQRKVTLFQQAFAAVVAFRRTNPYWMTRACIEIKWRGREYVARCYYVDPFSGGTRTFAIIHERWM